MKVYRLVYQSLFDNLAEETIGYYASYDLAEAAFNDEIARDPGSAERYVIDEIDVVQ